MKENTLIIGIALIVIGVIALCYQTYMLCRIRKVYAFRKELINLCDNYSKRHIGDGELFTSDNPFEWFLHKYTIDDMLHSFKPLRLDKWFTSEERSKIFSCNENLDMHFQSALNDNDWTFIDILEGRTV